MIKANADNCGVSVAEYLRTLGLNYKPKSVLDYKAIMELSQVNGDLGRLGGLLKMWLTNKEKTGSEITPKIDDILDNIEVLQKNLLQIAKRV